MILKDYYSYLGVSADADNATINNAYKSMVEKLGDSSRYSDSSQYESRLNVEEAYRILGVSSSLRELYDEEYNNSISLGNYEYEIQDDWLLSKIICEHNYVVNQILIPNAVPTHDKKWWSMKILGCIGKAFGIFILLLLFVSIKHSCGKQMRDTYNETMPTTESLTETPVDAHSINNNLPKIIERNIPDAEKLLQKTAEYVNNGLPKTIDDNVTHVKVLLTATELIYRYKVDDAYFSSVKDMVTSKSYQKESIKTVYSEMKPMIDLLVETHRGISYEYVCKESKKSEKVSIPYEELKDL